MTDEFGLTRRVQTRRAMERHALSLTRKITRIGWKPMALDVTLWCGWKIELNVTTMDRCHPAARRKKP